MKEYALRLERGADLKENIERTCLKEGINTALVLSSVGCLSSFHVRLAKALSELFIEDDFEILSLNGTVSRGEAHLHIAVSDDKGKCLGGHLKEGCIVNTTCELVLGILEEYESHREYDANTGYDEIVFKEKN